MAKDITIRTNEEYGREAILQFPEQFPLENDSELTVERLFLTTEGRVLGNYLTLEQTLSVSFNSSNPNRGLNGKVGIAYKPSIIQSNLPEDRESLPDKVLKYHNARLAKIREAYEQGMPLPERIGDLELIKD